VDFFGIPSATAQGAALFHLKTGTPIIFVSAIRQKWGKFDIHFERIEISEKMQLNEQSIFSITQTHIKILEKWIKKYPEQYFWTHKRWKTKPDKAALKQYFYNLQQAKNILAI
jgi:KDO2-lipid IV(A) lauroyltransferase